MCIDKDLQEALNRLWKRATPAKVGVFEWRVLLGRLPTRDALVSKGVVMDPHRSSCSLCFVLMESVDHFVLSMQSFKVYLALDSVLVGVGGR